MLYPINGYSPLLSSFLPSFLPSIIIAIIITTTTTTISTAASVPYFSLKPKSPLPYNLSTLLNTLGFHDISVAAASFKSNVTTTIFSPTDVSLRSCPYCSPPLLFLEHSVPGLYPSRLLNTLAFGTKVQTLASTPTTRLCLTLTKSTHPHPNSTVASTLFVGGVEITPDLFNDGNLIIQGYLAHLSPFSCQIELMTSLSFPVSPTTITPGLLKEALYHLRIREYTVLALLIQENLHLFLQLSSMTIFAVNDAGVFGDGHTFVSNFRFHVVPNQRLTALELINLPVGSELPTMVAGERLVITVIEGGGPLSPMRINNVRITSTNIVCNEGIAVHGIAAPLRRVRRTTMGYWPDETEGGPTGSADRQSLTER
ncbi:hypothetical protein L1987_34065 [Smallanthus sonchifolius]|uniref:Uncharacterized protein n=1 Tax=Smallanthus sonchifolius TaxID=185202 RepID=A0ACB9HTI4_9ASTR|nr:hypothetical protein L1987_34065 [Smallanthus sonchifolius]